MTLAIKINNKVRKYMFKYFHFHFQHFPLYILSVQSNVFAQESKSELRVSVIQHVVIRTLAHDCV